MGLQVKARDTAIAVPDVAVHYDFNLRFLPSSLNGSANSDDESVDDEDEEIIHAANFKYLSQSLHRELVLWCQARPAEHALEKCYVQMDE